MDQVKDELLAKTFRSSFYSRPFSNMRQQFYRRVWQFSNPYVCHSSAGMGDTTWQWHSGISMCQPLCGYTGMSCERHLHVCIHVPSMCVFDVDYILTHALEQSLPTSTEEVPSANSQILA